jgi:SAM-dependent methyltransferase
MEATEIERAKSFDLVAERYHRARPGYPETLVQGVLDLADPPANGRILEIGCGPGKATLLFAPFGRPLVCLEPGEKLAAIARVNLQDYPNVEIIQSRFEDWPCPEASFDLLISAQAFHWIEPSVAYVKSAQALKERGALALFWNREEQRGAVYRQLFNDAYARYAPELADPPTEEKNESWIEEWTNKINASGLFDPALVQRYPWSLSYNADQFIDLLGTHSDHILLPEQQQRRLFQAIREAIETLGGSIVVNYVTILFFTQRA